MSALTNTAIRTFVDDFYRYCLKENYGINSNTSMDLPTLFLRYMVITVLIWDDTQAYLSADDKQTLETYIQTLTGSCGCNS